MEAVLTRRAIAARDIETLKAFSCESSAKSPKDAACIAVATALLSGVTLHAAAVSRRPKANVGARQPKSLSADSTAKTLIKELNDNHFFHVAMDTDDHGGNWAYLTATGPEDAETLRPALEILQSLCPSEKASRVTPRRRALHAVAILRAIRACTDASAGIKSVKQALNLDSPAKKNGGGLSTRKKPKMRSDFHLCLLLGAVFEVCPLISYARPDGPFCTWFRFRAALPLLVGGLIGGNALRFGPKALPPSQAYLAKEWHRNYLAARKHDAHTDDSDGSRKRKRDVEHESLPMRKHARCNWTTRENDAAIMLCTSDDDDDDDDDDAESSSDDESEEGESPQIELATIASRATASVAASAVASSSELDDILAMDTSTPKTSFLNSPSSEDERWRLVVSPDAVSEQASSAHVVEQASPTNSIATACETLSMQAISHLNRFAVRAQATKRSESIATLHSSTAAAPNATAVCPATALTACDQDGDKGRLARDGSAARTSQGSGDKHAKSPRWTSSSVRARLAAVVGYDAKVWRRRARALPATSASALAGSALSSPSK